MAHRKFDRSDIQLIHALLVPLSEAGALLRPAFEGKQMVMVCPRKGVTLAHKLVSRRDAERLLTRGWVRREASPSHHLVITLVGEAAIRKATHEAQPALSAACGEEQDPVSGDIRIIHYKESPLAWLARRKNADGRTQIDALQFAAGERLRADFTYAGLTPRMTLDWTRYGAGTSSGICHPGLATDVMMAARQRLHAALDALGPDYAGLALDLCCFLKGIGDVEHARGLKKRTAKHSLIVALDILVRHYGLGARGPERGQGILAWAEP